MTAKPLILHHGNCIDGFSAGWWAHCLTAGEMFSMVHGDGLDPVFMCKDRAVYVLDYCFSKSVLLAMAEVAQKVVVLDHHETSYKIIEDLPFTDSVEEAARSDAKLVICLNKSRSGAGLTASYFKKKLNAEPPWWYAQVEDRDLWRFQLPLTREVHIVLSTAPMTATHWKLFSSWSELLFSEAGSYLIPFQKKLISHMIDNAHAVDFGEGPVLAVQGPGMLLSDAVYSILEKVPDISAGYAAGYYLNNAGCYVVSLRSLKSGKDVEKIAAKYGGGGHVNASAFRTRNLKVV